MLDFLNKKYIKFFIDFLCKKLKEDDTITIYKKEGKIFIKFNGKDYLLKNELDKHESNELG
jgi:chaperonin cofactor prefoldin